MSRAALLEGHPNLTLRGEMPLRVLDPIKGRNQARATTKLSPILSIQPQEDLSGNERLVLHVNDMLTRS